MNKQFLSLVLSIGLLCTFDSVIAASAAPDPKIPQPAVEEGNKWVYTFTSFSNGRWTDYRNELSVARVTRSGIYVTASTIGSTAPARTFVQGLNWSDFRTINDKEVVIAQPFDFPLTKGKKWQIKYNEDTANKKQETTIDYEVLQPESIIVKAGQFYAIKIEAEGKWVARTTTPPAPGQPKNKPDPDAAMGSSAVTNEKVTSGRVYQAYWYVPETKRYIKLINETYGEDGTLNYKLTGELISFNVQ